MEIIEVLQRVGLNQKEASIYLAVLELGTASVQAVSRKASIKRPTAYTILESLEQRGLVNIVPQHKKTLYVAESPERLLADLVKNQELVRRALPDLLALHNSKQEKPQVQLYQGKEGLAQVYEKILNSKNIAFFCTLKEASQMFPEVPKRFKQLAQAQKISMREMVTETEVDRAHAKWVADAYEVRIAPKESMFLTDNALFDENVAFFSYQPYPFVVVINSKGIVASLKSLFELAWLSAQKV